MGTAIVAPNAMRNQVCDSSVRISAKMKQSRYMESSTAIPRIAMIRVSFFMIFTFPGECAGSAPASAYAKTRIDGSVFFYYSVETGLCQRKAGKRSGKKPLRPGQTAKGEKV